MADNVVAMLGRGGKLWPLLPPGTRLVTAVLDDVQLPDGSGYTKSTVVHLAALKLSNAAFMHFCAMAAARGGRLEDVYSSLLEEIAADDIAAEAGAGEAATAAAAADQAGEGA